MEGMYLQHANRMIPSRNSPPAEPHSSPLSRLNLSIFDRGNPLGLMQVNSPTLSYVNKKQVKRQLSWEYIEEQALPSTQFIHVVVFIMRVVSQLLVSDVCCRDVVPQVDIESIV
jgi:hypothetical protein